MLTSKPTEDGNLKKTVACLAAGCLLLSLFLSLLSVGYAAAGTIFTIQAGSFRSRADALKQFDSIEKELSEQGREYLRVEKIGEFHAVRLGKFDDRAEAEEFLDACKSILPGAIVLDAYFIPERIERLYESPSSVPEPMEIMPQVSAQVDKEDSLSGTSGDIIPETVEEQIKTISDLLEKQDYDNALRLVKAAVAKRPGDPELNAWYGTVLLKMDYPDEALKYFRKASELLPGVPAYYNGAGYCLSFSGRFDEAVDEFSKVLALDPSNIDALTGLGVAYAKTGRKDRAMDIYIKLKDIEKDTAEKLLKVIQK